MNTELTAKRMLGGWVRVSGYKNYLVLLLHTHGTIVVKIKMRFNDAATHIRRGSVELAGAPARHERSDVIYGVKAVYYNTSVVFSCTCNVTKYNLHSVLLLVTGQVLLTVTCKWSRDLCLLVFWGKITVGY